MSDIIWPEKYLPGTTDNYVSNEVIVKNLSTREVWPFLNNTTYWPTYYNNAPKIGFDGGAGPELSAVPVSLHNVRIERNGHCA